MFVVTPEVQNDMKIRGVSYKYLSNFFLTMSFSFTCDFNFLLRPFWHDFFSGMTFVA